MVTASKYSIKYNGSGKKEKQQKHIFNAKRRNDYIINWHVSTEVFTLTGAVIFSIEIHRPWHEERKKHMIICIHSQWLDHRL